MRSVSDDSVCVCDGALCGELRVGVRHDTEIGASHDTAELTTVTYFTD
jgi:hypothetical protein